MSVVSIGVEIMGLTYWGQVMHICQGVILIKDDALSIGA